MAWYRIVVVCDGVPRDAGAQVAKDITEAFIKRPWHSGAQCNWDGLNLILTAENDYDSLGLALQDDFSDEISACNVDEFDGDLRILSVTVVSASA